jgi:16S rRNA (cytosine967-C5)-methyltransferase
LDANRKTAFYILRDVEANKAYSNIAANNHITRQNPRSPAFVRELAYGVIRRKRYLDYVIGNFVKTPLRKLHVADLTILRMGIYQILFMESVPEYAAVDESVHLARRFAKGRDAFVNGVLRQYLRDKVYVELPPREEDPVRYLSLKYSYEPWIVEMWINDYGEKRAEKLLAAGNETPPLTIRVNRLKTDRESLKKRLLKRGFNVYDGKMFDDTLYIDGVDVIAGRFYESGLYSVQDEGALAAVKALDPQPGEMVVDVCAAPGGKTMAIAEAMENSGAVVAIDLYKRKIRLINDQARRLGINIVDAYSWDALCVDSSLIDKADRVLVDVPCSGLGTVRHKPEIKYKVWDNDFEGLPLKQRDILAASSHYVKQGGVLVYSTCTIAKRENEQVTRDFLRKRQDFEQVDSLQLMPDTDGSDGFYICTMRRTVS